MATTGNGGPPPSPSAQQTTAQLTVLGQYIKDFSFENPNAPRSLTPPQTQPAINIQINVGAQQLAQTDYEISLKLEGKAESSGTVLFAFDLTGGDGAASRHDRMPAPVISIRARDRRNIGAQWWLSPAPARSGRFRRAVSAARGANAGGATNDAVELEILDLSRLRREPWAARLACCHGERSSWLQAAAAGRLR